MDAHQGIDDTPAHAVSSSPILQEVVTPEQVEEECIPPKKRKTTAINEGASCSMKEKTW